MMLVVERQLRARTLVGFGSGTAGGLKSQDDSFQTDPGIGV